MASVEELLRSLEGNDKKKEKKLNKDVLNFISDLNVESGLVAYPNYLIFYYYRMKYNPDARNKAKKTTFFTTFSTKFPSTRTENQRYYLLKEGLFDTSEKTLEDAKRYDQANWKKAPKRTIRKEEEV